jgi:hypothetical protein
MTIPLIQLHPIVLSLLQLSLNFFNRSRRTLVILSEMTSRNQFPKPLRLNQEISRLEPVRRDRRFTSRASATILHKFFGLVGLAAVG